MDKQSFASTNFAMLILLNIFFVISNLVCQLKVTLDLCLQYVTMIMLLVAISKLTYIRCVEIFFFYTYFENNCCMIFIVILEQRVQARKGSRQESKDSCK